MLQNSLMEIRPLTDKLEIMKSAISYERMDDLYFSYGSNMNQSQIMDRCSTAVAITTACLKDHRLVFCSHSDVWDGGVETVEPMPGEEVWGVLFSLSRLNWERLDLWQDARMDGGGMYFHYPDIVTDVSGRKHKVRFYKKDVQREPTNPSREYLDFIVQGAIEKELPVQYIESLKSREAKLASYAVPMRGPSDLSQAAEFSCTDCPS